MKNIFVLLFSMAILNGCNAQKGILRLEPNDFNDSLRKNEGVILLDVRTPEEYSKGFISRAVNMDYNDPEFDKRIEKLDKNQTYYVYCLAGGRSSAAINKMKSAGIERVHELKGGVMAWKKEGLPMVEMQ